MSLNDPRVKRPEEDMKDGRLDAMTNELDFIDATMSSNLRVKSTLNRRGQVGAHSRFPSNELQHDASRESRADEVCIWRTRIRFSNASPPEPSTKKELGSQPEPRRQDRRAIST